MDSTEIRLYGRQEQGAYNGHFECTCYHPLLLFNDEGDCLAAKLRPGNVHSAEGWEELLLPEIDRQQAQGKEVAFRGDAAFEAASWNRSRRVVAKVEFHFGELFPRVGFIVTNFRTSSRAVVRFYNKRGTAEQWIKEGKQAVSMTRLSCHRFRSNEVRLWLA
jgi:hypothetical protein